MAVGRNFEFILTASDDLEPKGLLVKIQEAAQFRGVFFQLELSGDGKTKHYRGVFRARCGQTIEQVTRIVGRGSKVTCMSRKRIDDCIKACESTKLKGPWQAGDMNNCQGLGGGGDRWHSKK